MHWPAESEGPTHPTHPFQITWMAQYSLQESYIFHPHDKQEVIVSYLPLSHVAAQIYDLWVGIHTGTHVCFAEPDAIKVGLRSAHVGAASGSRATTLMLVYACVLVCGRVLGALRALLGSARVRTLPAAAGTALVAGQEGKLTTMPRGKSRQGGILGPLPSRMAILRVMTQLATVPPSNLSHQLRLFLGLLF